MPLTPGMRLGSFEIAALIGVGGIGEVYRATDTNLKRAVAIKVLPPSVSADPARLARFQREAELLAALNHPNVAQIYGLEKSDGAISLVMELVDGDTLAERIGPGAIAVEEALRIATQIIDALEAAHERGIIHRDLKPANIKLRPDGTVKVLDFGLAKAMDPAAVSTVGSLSPTITTPAVTRAGVVLGTAAYMSPEQARGKPLDQRADIWAFGCVLFEMLAGRRPFGGDEVADVLANVLAREPEWRALPAATPPALRRLIARCLTKDPRERLHHVADARLELQDARVTPSADVAADATEPTPKPRPLLMPAAIVGAVALAVGLAAGALMWRHPAPAGAVVRLMLDAAPADEITTGSVLSMLPAGGRPALAWSPDGRTLAFIGSRLGTQHVFLRDLASGEARLVDGTQGTQAFAYSPDGAWIAFWTGSELRKMRVSGGPSSRICAATFLTGLTWGPTRIVYTTRYQIFEVSADGGIPRALTEADKRRSTPFLMPNDAALLYTEYGKPFTSGDEQVMLRRATDDKPQLLLQEAADARYLSTGHLVFMRQGTLFVVQFDAQTLELRGSPVAVLNNVAQSAAAWFIDDLTLSGQFAISPQGTLAYVPSPSVSLPTSDLVRVNRKGEVTTIGAPPNTYRERVAVSPDGTMLAVTVQSTTDVRLFLYDMGRGTLASAFPQQALRDTIRPVWSADGPIAMQVYRAGGSHPALLSADRTSVVEEPLLMQNGFAPSSWLRSGEALIGHRDGDLWIYKPSDGSNKWERLTDNPAQERYPAWSPDGTWLAYVSDVSGSDEVYVQRYPKSDSPILVSTAGGRAPVWNAHGRELIYVETIAFDQTKNPGRQGFRVMSVQMADPARPGRPQRLFDTDPAVLPLGQCASAPCYSISPDGQWFYTLQFRPRNIPRVTGVRLILNWFEDVRRLAPAN